MGNEREKSSNIIKTGILSVLTFIGIAASGIALAQSQSVVIPGPPTSAARTDTFHLRAVHPVSGKRNVMHNGTDYGAKFAPVKGQGTVSSCVQKSGYGLQGVVKLACGIEERFSHLSKCSVGGGMTSGNSGIGTGAHLHYEVTIDGTFVDPEFAYGKNLCDPDTRKKVLEDAASKGGKGGTAGTTAGNQSAAPTQTDQPAGTTATVVPQGGTNPRTGQVNTGSDYVYTEYPDGRIVEEPVISGEESTTPALPPPVTDELTQSEGSTSNEITGCAADTWIAMTNQSVMQVRREMMYNQRYIAKPDSVMAYSCFDKTIKDIGQKMDTFSGTKKWVNKQIDIIGKTVTVNKELGEKSLDGAINNTAVSSAQGFIMSSFPHDYLGGGSQSGGGGGGGGGGDEGSTGLQVETECGVMNQVWQMAKCANISDEKPFKKFDELTDSNSDPRIYPSNMKCMNTGITQQMIDRAKGKEVKFDKVVTYLDVLMPEGDKCSETPVSTGVTVVRRNGAGIITTEQTYNDGVCISPGCSYQNEGGSGKGKCEVKKP